MIFESNGPAETENIAATFAKTLRLPACIALEGDLGAGKTCFVRGFIRGLGGDVRAVSSPTYVLLNIYSTPAGQVYHLDAYRIGGADDFEGIGFAELLHEHAVVIVEWPQRIESILPLDCVRIIFSTTGDEKRIIKINSQCHRSEADL